MDQLWRPNLRKCRLRLMFFGGVVVWFCLFGLVAFLLKQRFMKFILKETLPKSSDPRKHSANRLDSSFLVKSVQTYRIHSDKAVIPSARTRRRWRKKKIRESPISCLIRLFWLDNVYREKALSILCGGGLKYKMRRIFFPLRRSHCISSCQHASQESHKMSCLPAFLLRQF